ncbi:MAG: signal peptidase I [Clostridium perfringens]|uniref:signal peptidase I n=1 Tax=Clostridium perfringens TaxID=1502 RepID=UPI00210E0366|nr:signal peptidase I [Clostridium perfringens]MDU7955848.1 signal peptidase I [Clostridium perfringens]MDU7962994.1 signal peptidase I [Clostridium perfringens]
MKDSIKILYNILFYSFLIIFIALLLLGFITNKSDCGASIGGYRVYDILTGSMSPTIDPGNLVVVKEISPNDVKTNDVITFKSDITNNVTTHRVIKIINDNGEIKFITKGDANNTQDPIPLNNRLLVGKVIFQIPYLGGILRSLQNNKIILICGFLFVIFVSLISDRYKKVKKVFK